MMLPKKERKRVIVDTEYVGYPLYECYKCGESKPEPMFPQRYLRVDGTGMCSECYNRRNRNNRRKKREAEMKKRGWSDRVYTPDMLGYDPVTPAQAKRNKVRHISV